MTAKWEQRLNEISKGNASPKQFMETTNKMINHLIQSARKNAADWSFNLEDQENFFRTKSFKSSRIIIGNCKLCDGFIIDKGSFFGCSNYQKTKCNFTISKTILGKNITQQQVKKLLKNGATEQISGFKGKNKEFTAKLVWDDKEKKIKFLFH